MVAPRHQVELFIHLMRETAKIRFHFVGRRINLETLARLGMMPDDARDRIMALSPNDYVKGPEPDHNHPGREVWVFGLHVSNVQVYVKVQIFAEHPERCVCISFHEAESPMNFPLRETGQAQKKEGQR